MRSSQLLLMVAAGTLLGLGSCESASQPGPTRPEAPFHGDLLGVAAEFKAWGRVDDDLGWTPVYCRAPTPAQVAFSASKDEETHGQKLYSLFARNRADYVALPEGKTVAVGQVVVKESWSPEEVTDPAQKPTREIDQDKVVRTTRPKSGSKPTQFGDGADHFYPYVWKGNKVYKATKPGALFIMMKLDPKTPGTDAGWVYATVTPDAKKVTSAGKIAACMKCHLEAKYDRLFGLQKH